MDFQVALEHRARVEEFQRQHRIGLLTLLFTDLVGSTKLKQDLGDRRAVALIQAHHAVVRDILKRFKEAEEISTAGDSFFIVFAKPSEAVQFSLMLQSRLRALSNEAQRPVTDRIGLHIGEVVIEERPDSPKPKDLYGLQVDICARVMSLADGDQILMTRSAFDNARQVLKGQDIEGIKALSWLNHGPYLLKGVEEPLEICEVGETSQAVLKPPPDSEKVHRYVSPDAEPVLGWRPAIDQTIPGTQWMLERKLGEGGFGEVWLGRHQTLKDRRVFKFCFRADRVRPLRREVTLFRILKERIGEHPNIVRVHDVFLDVPPYYLVLDYVEGGDLRSWCEGQGGVEKIPMATRLEIVAQVADALQAAHDAGVIHRDVKPSNILIHAQRSTQNSEPIAKLTDFGIGQVVSQEALAGLTKLGFTQTMMSPGSSSHTGTQMYMAPELMAGKPATTRSDIYSLGVVLYQILMGDFSKPVTMDWAKRVADPLLKEDLERCFSGDPENRFGGAGQLAKQLRKLVERRADCERNEAALAARERAAYRRGVIRTASLAAVIVAFVLGLALIAWYQSQKAKATASWANNERARAEKEKAEARHLLYVANMNLAQQAWEQNNIGRVRQLLEETQELPDRGFEWFYWQRQTHLALTTFRGHLAGVTSVAFSPDSQRIVTGSLDQTAKVWEIASGRELFTLTGHGDVILSVAFSPDGLRIVTGSDDQTAKVWDAANGKELFMLKGHNYGISSVAFSADGQRIVTGSDDKTAKVWEADSGKELLTLRGHTNRISSVAFSPDGQRIVSGSRDKAAKVWDAANGKELFTLKGHSDLIRSVAFSPNGQQIVTGSGDKTAKIWEAASGKELLTLKGHSHFIWSVAFSPDGQRIVTGSEDQTAKVWDAANGKELYTLKGHSDPIRAVTFSPDSQRIVTGSGDDTAKVWETASSNDVLSLKGHSDLIRSVAFSPDGRRIVTGSFDQTAKVWEIASGRELLMLKGHSDMIISVAFSSDGQRIVTGSGDNTAKVWETANGKELFTLKGHNEPIWSVAFSPDSRRIVTGSEDKTAKVWDAANGKELLTLKGRSGPIWSVAFSPDGQRIVTGSEDQTAKVWEAANGRELLTLKGHSGPIWCVVFSPNGQRIATGSGDKTARVWEAVNGKELLTFKGHSGPVWSVVISPNGQRLVTGSGDQTAKVWEIGSGRELLTLKGQSGPVMSVAFSPDGQRIVIGSLDRSAKVWGAASVEQVAAWQKEEKGAEERLASQRSERGTAK